ncbi:exopolysaccharide biosynthesis polyprenyl glycosylphosphotransferase [Haloactinopolyspora alba]|uniref:Exopolysaccharide biosynthesis polyprenyl glycosylphosphotransferase n=1 Tax=Haloactinopolyspora alba TaxID=648780 RepID=A0A2P8E5G7_9ACTN|nr:sugar transferase [Haloactinopolyspora alba]PSL04714.1 exopolysaccharide biosynthesis polyprenyl glycosylphosphotransferase [Haloactinopolyspora alba]
MAVGDVLTATVAAAAVWPFPSRPHLLAVCALAVSWPLVAAALARRGDRFLSATRPGTGVVQALTVLVAAVAIAGSLAGAQLLGGWLVAAAAILLCGSLLVRFLVARRVRTLRRRGVPGARTIVVGTSSALSGVIDRLAGDDDQVLTVVGACVEGADGVVVDTFPVGGPIAADGATLALPSARSPVDTVRAAAVESGAQVVCVAPGSGFTGERLRELGWALEGTGAVLTAELGLADVAAHRTRVGQAGASTLLQVCEVRFAGARWVAKSVVDRTLAAVGLALLFPLFAAVALAVRASGPGPVLYRQVRVGREGLLFTMLKFRTMHTDADRRRDELLASADGAGPMFKMRDDPRITRVGRVLRKYSLDELPQLVNVLRGEMSLVGPRPPLPEEVAEYTTVERRRLRAIPGMTGLWQVSGRSNLTWDETVRLDLRYVDNWSLGEDARLLGRTAGAVLKGTGAY